MLPPGITDPRGHAALRSLDIEKYKTGKLSWENRVSYSFNSYGYRSPEFQPGQDAVMVVGGGIAFGRGLALDDTFAVRLTRLLEERRGRPLACWNLSLPSQSADYVARVLLAAAPVLRPKFVFLQLPPSGRREHLFHKGGSLPFLPGQQPDDRMPLATAKAIQALHAVANPAMDRVNLVKNLKLCQLLLDSLGIPWLYGLVDGADQALLEGHAPAERSVPHDALEPAETDGELRHSLGDLWPGPAAHGRFAAAILARLETAGLLAAI
jgi:hypothetical protein